MNDKQRRKAERSRIRLEQARREEERRRRSGCVEPSPPRPRRKPDTIIYTPYGVRKGWRQS